jgi:hypothetical protein
MRPGRIEKGEIRKLSELEDHLYLLREQYHNLSRDPAHLSVIAAELRALICESDRTEGLLWRLTRALGVSDVVTVRAVGGVNPSHPLAGKIRLFVPTLMRPDPGLPPRFQCIDIEMRVLVKECLGAYSLGKSFTHEQLIKKIAQQIGSAHIDDGIEPGLATMEELLISGQPTYFPTVAFLAELTLEVGERTVAAAVASGKFRRRRYSAPITVSVHLGLVEAPMGRVPIVSFDLRTSAITLDAWVTPQTFTYTVIKRGRAPTHLSIPHPTDWTGQDAVFCLSYDHARKIMETAGPICAGDRADECDLGFVWASEREFAQPRFHPQFGDYLRYKAFYVFSRMMTADDARQIPGLLIEGPHIIGPTDAEPH